MTRKSQQLGTHIPSVALRAADADSLSLYTANPNTGVLCVSQTSRNGPYSANSFSNSDFRMLSGRSAKCNLYESRSLLRERLLDRDRDSLALRDLAPFLLPLLLPEERLRERERSSALALSCIFRKARLEWKIDGCFWQEQNKWKKITCWFVVRS